jgi:autoinducer 2 (AI-2) kinase
MGVGQPDDAGVVAGWSAAVQRVTRLPVVDDTHSMWSGRHVVPDKWVLEGNAGEMGGAYSWLASMLCGGMTEPEAMDTLEKEASVVEAGARGAAAYLGPSFVNIAGVGLRTGGILFPVPLAFEPADRGSIARAALESFAFAIRFNLDRLAQFGGPVKSVAIAGGMTRTPTFCRLVATTVGQQIGVARSGESATLGALSMAASAAGECSLDESLEARSAALDAYEPQRDETALYDDLYHSWRARERRMNEMEL